MTDTLDAQQSQHDTPPVSVVIPTRNEPEAIQTSIDSILAQDYRGDVEIIVADGSDDHRTVDAIRTHYPAVRVVDNPWGDISPGLNLGFDAANAEIIVRCDSRSLLPPDYISTVVKLFSLSEGISVVGGMVSAPDAGSLGTFQRAVSMVLTSPFGSGNSRHKVGGVEGPAESVYLGAFRRDSVMEAGKFDEAMKHNEDYELNWRIRQNGGTVWFSPGLKVNYTPGGRNIKDLASQYFGYGRSKAAMLCKHPKSIKPRQLAPPVTVLAIVVSSLLSVMGHTAALMIPVAYMLFLMIGAIAIGVRHRTWNVPLVFLVIATIHLSWGLGFFLPRLNYRPRRRERNN